MSLESLKLSSQLTSAEVATIQNISGLGDPNADRILFWDDSAGAFAYLTAGSGLTITGTTIEASGSGGASTALDNLASVAINAALVLGTSDAFALGSATKMWSDLFLADGAVINFNNGDVTITHSADQIAVGGGNLSLGANSLLMTGSIGSTGSRITKLWATDAEVTNAIVGSVTGNAATATALQNARTIGGVSFDGTANITVATATGGFTVSGGNLAVGTNSITLTGSIASTLSRVTKGWFTDLESTNMPTVSGTAILTSLTAPQFTTIELGDASDTTLSRSSAGILAVEGVTVSMNSTSATHTAGTIELGAASDTTVSRSAAGVIAVEGVVIPSISSTNTLTNKRITPRVQSVADAATITPDADADDCVDITAIAQAFTIANPTGTPTNFQKLIIRIKDNGTARAITFGNGYVAGGVALPTTTVLSKILTLGFIYNTANTLNKWQLVASAQEA